MSFQMSCTYPVLSNGYHANVVPAVGTILMYVNVHENPPNAG